MTTLRECSIKSGEVSLTTCGTEPVHVPGGVLSHGALLVLRRADLTVVQANGNTGPLLGVARTGCSATG